MKRMKTWKSCLVVALALMMGVGVALSTTTQTRSAIAIGWLPTASPSTGTLALNAANTWLALSFRVAETKTLSKVMVYASAVGGTLDGNDLECHVFSTSAGNPNASLSSTATVTTTPTGAAWVEFTGLTQSITGGTQYWIVLKNAAAAPATDFPTYQVVFGAPAAGQGGLNAAFSWSKKQTTDGSTWGSGASTDVMGMRLEYSDGSFDGMPIQAVSSNAVGDGVYSTRELGTMFTSPANVRMRVRGVQMLVARAGTTTGSARFRIYTGSTPSELCTTANFAVSGDITTTGYLRAYCSSTVTIEPSTVVRVVLAETTQSDTSSNRFGSNVMTIQNSAASKALTLFGGLQKTYYNGTSWGETDTDFVPFALILDTDGPFIALNTAPAGITLHHCTTP